MSPDAIAYLRNARYVAEGRFAQSVSGVWSPLVSWCVAPFVALGIDPLHALYAVLALWGAAAVWFAGSLLERTGTLSAGWSAVALLLVADATVKWVSLTAVGAALVVYYAVAVHTRGFGSYRQLLPLYFLQAVVAHAIIIAGIAIAAVTGKVNIYAANEYGGSAGTGIHVAAHTAAMLIAPLLSWIVGSIVLFVTRKVVKSAPRPTAATA